jgi:ribonuclease HII
MLEVSYQKELIEAGCDEAGRGCLAGAVFAAAVILPSDFYHPYLNDSKQMTERRRDELRKIIEQEAVAWYVAEVSPERIDQINILNASIEGMNISLKALATPPQFAVIDGNRFHTDLSIPWRTIVKGDGKYANIAAASVLAKTHRDEYMMRLAEEYPMYG